MFDGGFIAQPFAFGGEEGKEAFDDQMYYRNSLQNYAISRRATPGATRS